MFGFIFCAACVYCVACVVIAMNKQKGLISETVSLTQLYGLLLYHILQFASSGWVKCCHRRGMICLFSGVAPHFRTFQD